MSDDSSGRRRGLPALGIEAFVFIWGLAEATVFFIVPDVLLTFLAIDNLKRACWACVVALAGALIGGACMFAWGASNPSGAHAFLEKVPAIDAEMIETVNQNIKEMGQAALFLGPLAGRPSEECSRCSGCRSIAGTSLRLGELGHYVVARSRPNAVRNRPHSLSMTSV